MEYWECLSASAPTLVSADITGRALPAASGVCVSVPCSYIVMWLCLYVCVCVVSGIVYVCRSVCVCVYVCICMYVCMYACVCVHVYVRMCVCVYA